LDLLLGLLDYNPESRLPAGQALAHPFFDELRVKDAPLPEGHSLFDLTEEEIEHLKKLGRGGQDLFRQIVPAAKLNHEVVEGIKKRTFS